MQIEKWLPIRGYEGLYEVSDYSRVRSLDRKVRHWRGGTCFWSGRIKRQGVDNKGYVYVHLYKRSIHKMPRVHRLVAEQFISNPLNLPHINHIDGNKRNNNISNLEWVTPKENTHHAIRSGRCDHIFGTSNPNGYNRYRVAP